MRLRTSAAVLACAAVTVAASSAAPALAAAPTARASSLTWSIVPSPNRGGSPASTLSGISCTSATACTAVGESQTRTDDGEKTLIESWNGATWTIQPSASPNHNNLLYGVSCAADGTCFAVGSTYTQTPGTITEPKTLTETWNGTTWARVSSPNGTSGRLGVDYLDGVSCTSADFCVAVGYYQPHYGHLRTLVETWNGTSWTVTPSPSPGHGSDEASNYLQSVSCTSPDACTAVGDYATESKHGLTGETLIESWDGTSWTVQAPADVPGGGGNLVSVSCSAADACTAVGTAPGIQNLAETWNGSTWTSTPTPDPGGASDWNQLFGVSCPAANDCTATGYYSKPDGVDGSTVIESWDGTAWTVTPSPGGSGLSSVSCPSTATCTAAGGYATRNGHGETLIETGR